ncbi:MAG: sigma-B regulation protein RsbU (phosphoserine phosphatase) [Paraglaciecola sp.]|jgi:sigma-B regulation protein RsbU (phosphoserine phosphatase)
MLLEQLQEIEQRHPLSLKQLIEIFSDDIRLNATLLLVDASNPSLAYYADLNEHDDQLLDRMVAEQSIEFFVGLGQDLSQITAQIMHSSTQFHYLGETWVLPLLASDQTNMQVGPINKWLLLADPEKNLHRIEIENFYLKIGWALTCSRLHQSKLELNKATDWIEQELDEMSRLQQLMLPDKNTKIPGTEIAFTYRAMNGAGGDYIDFLSLEEDKTTSNPHAMGIIMADVTGHGPSAAVEAAMLDAILRTFKRADDTVKPSQVLDYVNKYFFTRRERSSFLTANIFHYTPKNRLIRYASAGHPHAYLKRGQTLIKLAEGGIPIGVIREYQWETYQQEVQKGDILFIYTDVVIETKSPIHGEFGFQRLEQALCTGENNPNLLIAHIEEQLQEFCLCSRFEDDMTMCAIQFTA